MSKNKKVLRWGVIGAIALIVLYLITLFGDDSRAYQRVDTSVALEQLQNHNAEAVQIDDREQRVRIDLREPITVDEREGIESIAAQYPARTTPDIFSAVRESGADKYETNVTQESFLMSMLGFMLPMVLVIGLCIYFMYRIQAGGGGPFGIGGSKAKQLTKDNPTNTFADVAGADEAVDELQEVVDFLTDPSVYEKLGAKIPRGVLLYGPPGTGKTLLARAVAGEAGVPFYTISGSDFVEMFVGVGASRVRDLFKQARENSPCIIFVDEIDAVGRQRGSGMGGGHDEREQTLNQLLVEMDGFSGREGVILIAATNRPDILDPALLRPGRFDRQIPVTNPDLSGRAQILKVHAKDKPLADDVSLDALAKRTAGMSGADLANVLNEAALLTARIGGNVITADALEEATDRVIGGPRRSSKVISEHEKKVTAYHEGGHTLAAWALKDIERVYKVTILARGRTGGFAMTADEDDKGMYTRDELFARMVFAMGGRSAEELVFGAPTTGASNDIEQATKIARAMVTEYGMTSALGAVKYGQEQGDPFSGRGGGGSLEYSPAVAAKIDEEMQLLLDEAHKVAYATLERYRDELDTLASKLLEKETLRRGDLEAIFDSVEPTRPQLPEHDPRFGRQAYRDPVKTPVEIAKERGEEPPKRFSILEQSKATRERRRKEREAEQQQPPKKGSTRWQQPKSNPPQYGGPKPPEGWTYKGAPANEQQAQPQQPQQHPGTRNYPAEPEQIGFRLPEHERPDHASRGPEPETTPVESDEETTQLPREERQPRHRREDD
ncbi:ATP-dependent zinc metalloprotease FtsH [Corynebacterium fournieri]|uniref:ATP-dependent zinc metalloprotease FtsH n=1 Tax=Corynebacterium fournieri TaxID=1852390 RepID=UPI000A2F2CBA|nr:ATP-dependent zinc metalloprotease FtsH [Corynebacterium fournieri]WJY98299.1 ATP-dependent zinc metalloprotease FtsH [Corynebacterium fournieri]